MNKFSVGRFHFDEEGKVEVNHEEFADKSAVGLFLEIKENHRLNVTEALARDLSQVLKDYSLNINRSTNMTEDDIPLKFAELLRYFGGLMEYFINSTSWREKELQGFDLYELRGKIKVLERLIENNSLK